MRQLSVYALALVLGTGCTPSALQIQVRAVNALALGANRVLPSLESAYRTEGLQAIDAAHTEQEALLAIEQVRQHWRPVWGVCTDEGAGPSHRCHDGAWPALVAAQDAWAMALEHQAEGTPLDAASLDRLAQQIQGAYCALSAALPSRLALDRALTAGCTRSP